MNCIAASLMRPRLRHEVKRIPFAGNGAPMIAAGARDWTEHEAQS